MAANEIQYRHKEIEPEKIEKEVKIMKKKVLEITFFYIFTTVVTLLVYPARVYAGKKIIIKDYINNTATNVVQVPMFLGKNCNKDIAIKTTVQINHMPTNVIRSFNESGWTLKMITAEEMKDLWKRRTHKAIPPGVYVAGLTSFDRGSGIKEINLCDLENTPQRAVVHEFGHFVDVMNGLPSTNSRQFAEIYYKEKDTYIDSDGSEDYCDIKNNIHEYYASIFDEYIKNPENLRVTAPESYLFIDRCVKDIPVGKEKNTFWY